MWEMAKKEMHLGSGIDGDRVESPTASMEIKSSSRWVALV